MSETTTNVPIDDADAYYCYSYRTCAIFPYAENGLAVGEDVYSDGPMTLDRLRKLEYDELPPSLQAKVRQKGERS